MTKFKSPFGGYYHKNDADEMAREAGCPQSYILVAFSHGDEKTLVGDLVNRSTVLGHVSRCGKCFDLVQWIGSNQDTEG